MSIIFRLPREHCETIFSLLDPASLVQFASTSRYSASLVVESYHGANSLGPVLLQLALPDVLITGRSFTNFDQLRISLASTSSGSVSASDDTLDSSDTEMSSPEPEYEFQMTKELMARVAQLPAFKPVATLQGLPNELQLMIFGHLDEIDSVCLGLSNTRSYNIHRALHGPKMPLNTRRPVPNPLERAWEGVGRKTCLHCGNYRCQLYEHIKSWMPEGLEYCQFSQKFGSCAEKGAKDSCYRGKPSKPNRCGRHPVRTTTIHQDDPMIIDNAN